MCARRSSRKAASPKPPAPVAGGKSRGPPTTPLDLLDGSFKSKFARNLERCGAVDEMTTAAGLSQVVQRTPPLDSFDIIYIDGSHAKNDVLEDAVLCWRSLRGNGLMVFDDYHTVRKGLSCREGGENEDLWYPKPAIDAFVQCFDRQCEVIHNGRQLIVRKKI